MTRLPDKKTREVGGGIFRFFFSFDENAPTEALICCFLKDAEREKKKVSFENVTFCLPLKQEKEISDRSPRDRMTLLRRREIRNIDRKKKVS